MFKTTRFRTHRYNNNNNKKKPQGTNVKPSQSFFVIVFLNAVSFFVILFPFKPHILLVRLCVDHFQYITNEKNLRFQIRNTSVPEAVDMVLHNSALAKKIGMHRNENGSCLAYHSQSTYQNIATKWFTKNYGSYTTCVDKVYNICDDNPYSIVCIRTDPIQGFTGLTTKYFFFMFFLFWQDTLKCTRYLWQIFHLNYSRESAEYL